MFYFALLRIKTASDLGMELQVRQVDPPNPKDETSKTIYIEEVSLMELQIFIIIYKSP